MADCLQGAIIHEHIGESIIPCMIRKSAEKYQELLTVEFHYERYSYYQTDFSSLINICEIIFYLNKNLEAYYLIIKDILIRNTPQDLLCCDLIVFSSPMCVDKKIDLYTASNYPAMVIIDQTIYEVQMHVGRETYLNSIGKTNLSQVPLWGLFQFLRNDLCSLVSSFSLSGDEQVKQIDNVSIFQYIALSNIRKFSHFNEIGLIDIICRVLNTKVISISHKIRIIKNPILISMLVKQQIILVNSIINNCILLYGLQRILTILFTQWCADNNVRINLSSNNLAIFSTDIGKEYLIAHIIFALLLDITLCNLQSTFDNKTTHQRLINHEYKSNIRRT